MIQKYGMRPEDYPKVFPSDKERVFVLTPTDGKFDELEEEFSALITDIVGGREYRIVALVRDVAGNERIVEIKTPYIRQFENIAKTDDVLVGATYSLWYGKDGMPGPTPGQSVETPLVGRYFSTDPIIISKHIDWATGHGIDFFVMGWDLPGGHEDIVLKDYFLKNDLSKDIKFVILYPSFGRLKNSGSAGADLFNFNDPYNRETFVSDIQYILYTYGNNPQYLKINNSPVIYLYLSRAYSGDFGSAFNEGRSIAKEMGFKSLFIIGDEIPWILSSPTQQFLERAKKFDAIGDWAGLYYGVNNEFGRDIISNYEKYLEEVYKNYSNYLNEINVPLVPSSIPGFDNRLAPWGNPNSIPLLRDPYKFKERLSIALKYMNPQLKMIRIDTWNDWYENTQIEPSLNEGLLYLQILKEILREYNTQK
jgi:hypothetical protein